MITFFYQRKAGMYDPSTKLITWGGHTRSWADAVDDLRYAIQCAMV
jgi:hypothetical protein